MGPTFFNRPNEAAVELQRPPSKLYKYITSARLDVLEKLLIRFTQPGDCNDPFEIKPLVGAIERISVIRERMEAEINRRLPEVLGKHPKPVRDCIAAMEKAGMLEDLKRQAQEYALGVFNATTKPLLSRIQDELATKLGILSLTEDPLSPPMWAHYAEDYRGMILEFDAHHYWFHGKRSGSDELRHLRKVVYLEDLRSEYLVDLEGFDLCYRKGKTWEYEREWRIVRSLDEATYKNEAGIYLYKIPPDALTGVIFGTKAPNGLRERVRILVETRTELRHLVLRQAFFDESKGRIALAEMSAPQDHSGGATPIWGR